MSKPSIDYEDELEENKLEMYYLDKLAEGLSDYFGRKINLSDIEIDDLHKGSFYNTYKLIVDYSENGNGKVEGLPNTFVAKYYHGNGKENKSLANREDQRKDLVLYEATVLRNMNGEFVPKYVYSNNTDLLVMEYLGDNSLEKILSSYSRKGASVLEVEDIGKIIDRLAAFHDKLAVIVTNEFKNTSKADYTARFDGYMSEMWEGKTGTALHTNSPFRREVRDAFRDIGEIFKRGSITGNYNYNSAIHNDFHPAHIIFKLDDNKTLKPYFIDFKPRDGPMQFDLVDILAHPLVLPFFKDGEKQVENFARRYLVQSLAERAKRLGLDAKATISDEAFNDFMGMMHLARVYRGHRNPSKSYSYALKRPKIYDGYVKENGNYPYYKYWYIADASTSLQRLIKDYHGMFDSNFVRNSLDKLSNIIEDNFSDEISRKDEIVDRLKIKEESKF